MIGETVSIIASPSASFEQLAAAILSREHGEYTEYDIRGVIVPTYYSLCTEVGVDPNIAIAQMILETGNLTSFWAARPQRNPAGIGVTGQRRHVSPANPARWAYNTQRQCWERGLSFATWRDDAIPAHVGRLLAYALPKGGENAAQRSLIERALSYRWLPDRMRGSAPIIRLLGKVHNPTGQGWASPGTTYGAKIAARAERIAQMDV